MNEENNILKETIIEFCEKNLDEKKIESEKIGSKVISDLASQGFLGAIIPEKYGGSGLDETSYNIILEEISRYSPSTAMKILITNSMYFPSVKGTEFESTLSDVASGKKNVSVDFINSGNYIIDGNKIKGKLESILNADADSIVVFHDGTELIEGKFNYKERDFMGFRGLTFGDIEINNDFKKLGNNKRNEILESLYIPLSAVSLGIITESIKKAMDYTGVRKAFGNYLRDFEPVSFRLSSLLAGENILRNIIYDSMDKYYVYNFAMESLVETARYAVNSHGGYGYFKDFGVEKFYRDAIVLKSLFYGNNELKKLAEHAYGEKLNFV